MKALLKKIKYRLLRNKGIFYPKYINQWYEYHQNHLRGSADEIKQRQEIYLPYIKQTKNSFLDVGFGRGEFLEIVKKAGQKNIEGVDSNYLFYKSAKQKGFNVHYGDALEFLYVTNKKFSGISAFHFIEHLKFPQLFDFLLMCNKKIEKGGQLILETPNINNLQVSSINFYYDFTHVQKITPILLQYLLRFVGFSKIKFLYLHPMKKKLKGEIEQLVFGAQDLGVIAIK
jgi:O-antigen chain-terminating methyltransferase